MLLELYNSESKNYVDPIFLWIPGHNKVPSTEWVFKKYLLKEGRKRGRGKGQERWRPKRGKEGWMLRTTD